MTYKGAGTTGFYTDYNHLTQNFLIANYDSSQGIDNDDGSAVSAPPPAPHARSLC